MAGDRQAELLPVPYFHVVFTLPGPIADIAYQNQAVVYDLLSQNRAETLITIAATPKHLAPALDSRRAHTWGSTLTTIRMPTSSSREARLSRWRALDRLPARLFPPVPVLSGSSVVCSSNG